MPDNRAKAKNAAISRIDNHRFRGLAQHFVSPGDHKAIIAPSLCPSRCGTVNFPIVVDVGEGAGMENFAIIVEPSLEHPLRISHPTAVPETSDKITGFANKFLDSSLMEMTASRGCSIGSVTVGGRPAIPWASTLGSNVIPTINIMEAAFASYDVTFDAYDGSSWITLATGPGVGIATYTFATVVYASTYTHFSFTATPADILSINGSPLPGECNASFSVTPTGGGVGSCALAYDETVFDIYQPEWQRVLEAADKVSIPFMDCLVTYQGSTLDNAGAIAVCAASEDISPGVSYYASCASRPFDKYEGRLASSGSTDGGAHWHLLHDDIRAYSLTSASDLVTGPKGYFGIKGKLPNQVVRVCVNITLNYYTIDPSFQMDFQPPWGEMDLLLYTLRTSVPMVSSNDKHLDKLKKLAKRKAMDAAKWAMMNPEEAVLAAASAAEVVGSLLV